MMETILLPPDRTVGFHHTELKSMGKSTSSYQSRTVAKSFRINTGALESIHEEASRQMLSVNTLVNRLLLTYSNYGRYTERMQVMMMSKQTFNEFLEPLSEEAVIKAGQNAGKTFPAQLIIAKYGKISVDSMINFVHSMSAHANWFEYLENSEGGHWVITLTHQMGRKWSLFIANYLTAAFAATACKPKCVITDRYVTLTI